ncbi:HAD hydrolase family protein [Candidatus Thioglobus sp.]|nr:HAD hydrolase family protein [Candidatus Thioglobus sp.]
MIRDNKNIDIDNVQVFVFDFDGVLTNNLVHLDQDGKEFVTCSRSDGLAFDVLRKLNKSVYILSTERNSVVTARANKLNIKAIQGVSNKVKSLSEAAKKDNFEMQNVLYVGNDLNDYKVMQSCGFSVCPSDSHQKIKEISDIILETTGGNGVVRELLENILGLDFIEILY